LPTIYCSIVELSLQDSLYILFREIQSGRSVVMPQLYKSDLQIYIPIYSKGCYRNHSVSKSLHSHAQLCTVMHSFAQSCTALHSQALHSHSTALHSHAQSWHSFAQSCTVHAQSSTALHSYAQSMHSPCTALHSSAQFCTALHSLLLCSGTSLVTDSFQVTWCQVTNIRWFPCDLAM
jgi:hypothetical protein